MQIALRPEQEMFVLEKVNQGVYGSPEELFALAFQLLEEHELKKREDERKQQEIEQVRQKVLAGVEDVQQGRVVDGEVVFEQLEERLSKKAQEKFALFLSQLPYVSDEEQADIEKHMNVSPNFDRSEYVDMTDWVRNEANL
ncbi:MAG: type II toxin-antitoxin system ParD family antitoxin [Pseudanabaena sp.]|jgi:antitoxin ParD1/3/4